MRIQVMFLPAPPDEYPFVLVFDQVDPQTATSFEAPRLEGMAAAVGAKTVLVFADTVEVL